MNKKEIEVNLGKEFKISLNANPTTGFTWEASFDENFIELKNKTYEITSDRIGGGGKEIITFMPIKLGKAIITFNYKRPWEKKIKDQNEVLIKIKG